MLRRAKRKKMFIDPEVQGTILWRLGLHWLLAVVTIVGYLFVMQVLTTGFTQSFSDHCRDLFQKYGMLLVVLATVFPVFAWDSVKLSHRFAGPMYSFRRTLRQLASGENVRQMKFRRKDFWKEMADDLNTIAERLHRYRCLCGK